PPIHCGISGRCGTPCAVHAPARRDRRAQQAVRRTGKARLVRCTGRVAEAVGLKQPGTFKIKEEKYHMEFDFKLQPGLSLHKRGLRTDGTPLVSIITPYYNGGKYFEQTFNSVMNQTFPWFEWIIVDDGSTESADLCLIRQFA